jgi:type I restriction enzyme S subunit
LCTLITDGDHGVADYQVEGVPFILSENVKEGWIDIGSVRYISERHHQSLAKSKIRSGDVLVTKTGVYFGKSAVVDEQLGEANTIAHVGILRLGAGHDPYVLSTFLNCRYGQTQLRRRGIKATRPEIKLVEFQDIQAPLVSLELAQSLRAIIQKSKGIRREVEKAFLTASSTLLAALGLAGWTPPEPLAYSARASDAFAAGRLDAQYFRPLFAEIAERLRLTGHGVELGSMLTTNARGRQPQYAVAGLPVVNSKHVRTNRVLLDDNRTATEEGSRVIIGYGDVLVNGTGVGTIGRAAAYLHPDRALPDNHVTVLRAEHLDPVYLALFLNSPLGQWQIERYIKGSSGQIELYPNDIAKVVVWQAPKEVQSAMRQAVMDAFAQERRAKELLVAAKRAFEIAIEDSEAAAIGYLTQVEQAA